MNDGQKRTLSLKAAYGFAAEHDLEEKANDIRDMYIKWDLKRNSTLRRGYIVALFEKHGLFQEFKKEHWVWGNTPSGETARLRFLRIKAQYEDFLAGSEAAAESDVEGPGSLAINLKTIAMVCAEECELQGGGVDELGRLLQAWALAVRLARKDDFPGPSAARALARMIDPRNTGYRSEPFFLSNGKSAVAADEIEKSVDSLFSSLHQGLGGTMNGWAFAKALLDLHPFTHGNHYIAFLLLNWIASGFTGPHPL